MRKVDTVQAHASTGAVVAWRSPIFYQINTDDNTLVFQSPISFYNIQFMLHAFKGPLEAHTERIEHSV